MSTDIAAEPRGCSLAGSAGLAWARGCSLARTTPQAEACSFESKMLTVIRIAPAAAWRFTQSHMRACGSHMHMDDACMIHTHPWGPRGAQGGPWRPPWDPLALLPHGVPSGGYGSEPGGPALGSHGVAMWDSPCGALGPLLGTHGVGRNLVMEFLQRPPPPPRCPVLLVLLACY